MLKAFFRLFNMRFTFVICDIYIFGNQNYNLLVFHFPPYLPALLLDSPLNFKDNVLLFQKFTGVFQFAFVCIQKPCAMVPDTQLARLLVTLPDPPE